VMVEFDSPGHAWSWGVGYPSVLPDGYAIDPGCPATCPVNPCDVPVDPSNDLTYQVLTGILMDSTGGVAGAGLFPEGLIHMGGDEVSYECWDSSAQIKKFMALNNFTTYDQVYEYYVLRSQSIAFSMGRTPVHWEEVYNHFGTDLDPRAVIHVWLDHSTLAQVVADGYRGILSDNDVWYLDNRAVPWTSFYLNDPYQSISDPTQRSLVLGGEACMWGELIDSSNIHAVIWPRAAAFAERLWNYNIVNVQYSVELAYGRLNQFRCLLEERGIGSGPVFSFAPFQPSSCYDS